MPPKQRPLLIGLSAGGDKIELAEEGLGLEHIEELMVRLAMRLLQQEFRLAFGGNLVEEEAPLTEHLINAALNWQSNRPVPSKQDPRGETVEVNNPSTWPLLNYSAWPQSLKIDPQRQARLVGVCEFRMVRPKDTSEAELLRFSTDLEHDPAARRRNADALTEMRVQSTVACDLRIVWGGRIRKSKGWLPGILEEVYLTLQKKKPVLILGGFGGCAGKLAKYLKTPPREKQIDKPNEKPVDDWPNELSLDASADNLRDSLLTEAERAYLHSRFEACKAAIREYRANLHRANPATSDRKPTGRAKLAEDSTDLLTRHRQRRIHGLKVATILDALDIGNPRDAIRKSVEAAADLR
ncbi:MAG: hypothetical protein NT069_34750 [Planctomycetota bacterium]|nr:hypothetical protein [Planctomycetota bacterium]